MLKDNVASVNELNFTSTKAVVNDSPMQVCPQPKIKKTQAEWTARGCVVPKRPMKNSSENEKTKIARKICPVKPAQEHLKCNSQERQNKLEQNSNQSVKVPSKNRILSLNSVANSCKRKAVQTKINFYIHSIISRVPEEIASLEKRINETFSYVRRNDANILKFDEELETPRCAIIVENYSNVVPKKIKICSTIRKPSRHKKRTGEIETGNFSGWTTEKEKSVVIFPEELDQKFQTVEPQESEIIFETNHFVLEETKISCYQTESYIECNEVEQPALRMNIINGLQNLHCNSLTSIIDPATEKRLDFVQRGVNKEMPPYSYKTPRKRKPPDKISFTIRGLG